MNKKMMAALVSALAAHTAIAQSNVSIYGIADVGYAGERGGEAGNVSKITSGASSYSRLGFRGSEEIGNGVSAIFTLESGVRMDTGELDVNNTLFNRQAWVGLKTRAGTLTLGRQYTPWHLTLSQVADPFKTGYAGTSKNLFPDSGTNVRMNNSVVYATPTVQGFSGTLAYGFGEQTESSRIGRQMGASLGYNAGKLAVRFGYNNRNTDVAAVPGVLPVTRGSSSNKLLAGTYDFGILKLHGGYGKDKGFNSAPLRSAGNPYGGIAPTASTDSNVILLGLSAPVPGGVLMASVMRKDDETRFDQDARGWGIAYDYVLSKRSTLYTSYGAVSNQNGAAYTAGNNSEAGTGNRQFNMGMRHAF
jgi:predicted porin